jgi:hypothetical protein
MSTSSRMRYGIAAFLLFFLCIMNNTFVYLLMYCVLLLSILVCRFCSDEDHVGVSTTLSDAIRLRYAILGFLVFAA